ncbi:MAG TPA: NUDIX domain-containing protein [Actinospica sp.]|jgi:8-oxo-dGTP pyrophosphatase MutT (NUDIX family)|nr:NUDIX domain-containing protein [Actinospica sp.]
MTATPLAVTDPVGGNVRHAVGVHTVLIDDQGRILLGQRADSLPLAGGKWSTTCGNLELESAPDGAVREVREEIGVEIDPLNLRFAHLTHFVNDQGFGPAMALFFTARTWIGTPRICEPDKCQRIGWFSFDDLPQPIVPYVENALTVIRAGLSDDQLSTAFSVFGWPTS